MFMSSASVSWTLFSARLTVAARSRDAILKAINFLNILILERRFSAITSVNVHLVLLMQL